MHAYVWSLLARRRLQPFWEMMYKVTVRGMGCNNYAPQLNGEYRVLAHVLGEIDCVRPVVFDVGANEGEFTARVLELCPGAEVHAFEPNPPTYARLERQFASFPQVRLHALGLSEKNAVLRLADYADADGSGHASFSPAGMAAIRPSGRSAMESALAFTAVRVATLDSIIAERGIERIDYLKIDVEGHERSVLLGACETIAARRCRNIQIEVNAHNAVIGCSLHRLAALLPGYEIYKILPDGLYRVDLHVLHDMFRYANFLFREPGSAAPIQRKRPARAPRSAGETNHSEFRCAASFQGPHATGEQRF